MSKNGKKTMAERAMRHGAGLVLRDFCIIDLDSDDNPMFTLNKQFPDGSKLVMEMAMAIREILRLCRAEGIDPDGEGQLEFRKAPIRVAEVGSRLAGDDDVGCGWYNYAVCDFPGIDAEESDLEAVELQDEEEEDDGGADEEGFGEDD